MATDLAAIERIIRSHPGIASVSLEDSAEGRIVGRLVPRPGYPDASQVSQWGEKRVSGWHLIWERAYSALGPDRDPALNTTSWISSYTGRPIPDGEMREWLDHAVSRISVHAGARILELGCGTGMILQRLAPPCSAYVGTDLSAAAIAYVRARALERGLSQVTLLERPANDFDSLPKGSFDRVLLNSVVQYFPSARYLEEVLRGAASMLAPGGFIFVGDVRSLPLSTAFYASQALVRASPDSSRRRVRLTLEDLASREGELLLDPWFFQELGSRLPGVTSVDVLLKRGASPNEMTRFRYDVILRSGTSRVAAPEPEELDWERDRLDLVRAGEIAASVPPGNVLLRRIPNGRLTEPARVLAWLEGADPDCATLGELRARLTQGSGIDPEQVWTRLAGAGRAVDLLWSSSREVDRMDAALRPSGAALPPVSPLPPGAPPASDPLRATLLRHLSGELNGLLSRTIAGLPPVTFVLVDRIV